MSNEFVHPLTRTKASNSNRDVVRVGRSRGRAELAALGREVEAQVLARVVTWHAEHR